MASIWILGILMLVIARSFCASGDKTVALDNPLLVNLTLIQSAAATGAVCLDGTLPGYHLHRGSGSGVKSWLIHLECDREVTGSSYGISHWQCAYSTPRKGGGWCNDTPSCVNRRKTALGSSNYMEKIVFTGILSNKPNENPDFYNWNRVKLRYCDGASFKGEGSNEAASLQFRGQRIWVAAMKDLMSNGMKDATQALLSGCSAGGLASILHCDEFHDLFNGSTKVKCLADAGMFLDAVDVAGGHTLRKFYNGVVTLQGVSKNLPGPCTSTMDATSCFFPENLVANITTPLFLLSAAYDVWQITESLATDAADPQGYWKECKSNYAKCNESQIQFLQNFRNELLNSIDGFTLLQQNGWFINSCFSHCQTEGQDTWFGTDSPAIADQRIAKSVGDWFFDRRAVKETDCPYPCDNTCRNIVFDRSTALA